MEPRDIAAAHQQRVNSIAAAASLRAVRLFRRMDPSRLDFEWDMTAPALAAGVAQSQVYAARQATAYTDRVATALGASTEPATLVPEAFAGVTREGREIAPELFTAVTTTKKLIGAGSAIPSAFRAGAGVMSLIAANLVRDAARSADHTIAVGKGFTRTVRVINAGACSRCAILAGVQGYRTDFQRHPGCRCYSMPIVDNRAPTGMFSDAGEYFSSLSSSEQDRVFTKDGAEAIRLGADPVKVVNARRGALTSSQRADGSYSPAHLRPVTIGRRADGSPLQVYVTPEGTTARGQWGRVQNNLTRNGDDRYRRTTTLRLMPEQIIRQAGSPERARELLARYGYLN